LPQRGGKARSVRAAQFAEAAAQLAGSLSLDAILTALCRAATTVLGYSHCWIALLGSDGALNMVAQQGFPARPGEQPAPHDKHELLFALARAAIDSGEPQICHNLLVDVAYERWRDEAAQCGFRSAAAFALRAAKGPIGALVLCSERENPFDEEERALLSSFALHSALAISAARESALLLEMLNEQKSLQRVVAESRDRYRTVIDSTPDIVFAMDGEGRITFANRRAAELAGVPITELIGQPVEAILAPQSAELVKQAGARGMAGESVLPFEVELVHSRGARIPAEVHTSVTRDASGKIIGVQGVARDIRERKKLEEQLQHLQRLETVSALAAGVAHDFNNILMAILGSVSLMRAEAGADHPWLERLGQIEKSAERAAQLTQSLLAFSQQRTPRREPVDLGLLLREFVRELRKALPESITVRTHLRRDVPPISGEATQLRQALENICANAREAMPDGGTLSISLSERQVGQEQAAENIEARPGRFAVIAVRDTGCGMDEETRARLFEPFFTTKDPEEHRGLGLAVAYGIVKAHEGWIAVRSEPGRGTTVEIFLPRHAAPAVEAPVGEAAPEARQTILVVDDEEIVRGVAREALEAQGYRVFEAEDGVRALEIFRAHAQEIDLVVLDLTMPRMNGAQCLGRLREINPEVKVIMTSGHIGALAPEDLGAEDMPPFLRKPYRLEQLVSIVRLLLGQEQ